MPAYEVNFSGWLYIADAIDPEDATYLFKEAMGENSPEIDVDKIIEVEEVK